jgi:hypothetical protein
MGADGVGQGAHGGDGGDDDLHRHEIIPSGFVFDAGLRQTELDKAPDNIDQIGRRSDIKLMNCR